MSRVGAIAIRPFTRLVCVLLCVALAPRIVFAQQSGGRNSAQSADRNSAQSADRNDPHLQQFAVSYYTAPGTGVLVFTVFAERATKRLDRQALMKLVNLADQSTTWQTTEDAAQGVFTNVPFGSYEVEISAVGYFSDRQQVQVDESLLVRQIDVVLHRDPAAINLDVSDAVMSPRARKDARRAISLLKSNRLDAAQKQLEAAFRLSPSSPELNFLLGYLYFQKGDFTQAETYLGTSVNLNPHNGQALTLLGRSGLERSDYPAARSALEQAVLADAENWLPHSLLADTYLQQKNYDKARDEAEVAVAKGKNLAGPAQVVLGESLIGLGRNQEGIHALNTFLEQSPANPLADQVRSLISQVNQHDSNAAAAESKLVSQTPISGVDPLSAVAAPTLSVKSWQPPGIDEVKPATAASVTCPLQQVIEESGKSVVALVEDVERFAAVEDLLHQALDKYGVPIRTETRKYNYVASISEPEPGFLSVDEYRADKLDVSSYPDHIVSTGFAAMALVFHPHMRDNFEMICEGLGDWHGQATWLVQFRQRDDRPNRMHSYKIGNSVQPVALKGRAWITADKFQIVRIEAEMVHPMPEIQLLSEHQIVEYGPVPFPSKNTTLWLPKKVEIYLDFHKHRYYRRHSFDHYMLYSVDSVEKRKEPGKTPKPADVKGKPS